jgi:alpha 1,2-mannosyltransferase
MVLVFVCRGSRFLAVFPIACAVYLLHLYHEERLTIPDLKSIVPLDLNTPLIPPETTQELWEDAHRLSTADAFRDHFENVIKMPAINLAEAKSTCNWQDSDPVNFQYTPDTDWAVKDRDDFELATKRSEWHNFIQNELIPYEDHKDRFNGRGIVIVAGHEKSLKRVRVLLKALEKLGSKLPVELHYWENEMTPGSQIVMSALWPEIYFNDLASPFNFYQTNKDGLANYQLKTAALLNSRFAEPLLLDSDNIPTIDPESLYSSNTYLEYGTIFWPDIARTRPNNPIWAITNTHCRKNEYEQESGQLLVDKRRFFYHLQLAAWFDNAQNVPYYEQIVLGDKDLFRFAWHALKTKYGTPPKWLTSVGLLSDDGYYCGHTFAQHHPDGRVAFMHGGLLKQLALPNVRFQHDLRGGINQVYKRSARDEDHAYIEQVGIKWDEGLYVPDRPQDMALGSCTDMYAVDAKPLDEILPGFEKTFEEVGGYWMLNAQGALEAGVK